ncbi:hypothetical protein U91I_01349 [alpha proteobacterium U9-1i]|nr:hypothetical protein U91I_01349 [alpha proteobacterium U9-1i]
MTEQCDRAFAAFGVEIPSPCSSVALFLAERGEASIAEIARATGYSHQLISQRLALLESLSFCERIGSATDKRKLRVQLSRKGRAQVKKLEQALARLSDAVEGLNAEIGVDLGAAASAMQRALDASPLIERMTSKSVSAPNAAAGKNRGRQE